LHYTDHQRRRDAFVPIDSDLAEVIDVQPGRRLAARVVELAGGRALTLLNAGTPPRPARP
jgi:hypothetical protein